VEASQGFKINATNISLDFGDSPTGVQAGTFTLSAYGQASLQLQVTGASVASPVNITLTSSCVTLGKASLSPANLTVTGSLQPILYRDLGCGALQTSDEIQAAVVGSSSTAGLSMPLARPEVSSVAFVSAVPEAIYLRGSGLADSSAVTFQIRDGSGNPLSNEVVSLALVTGAGGVQLEGRTIDQGAIFATSDANGEVTARINSGTVPTPVRVQASVASATTTVSTVSSNLSVAVGLPSQRNFSLSQTTRNIEGFNLDGTTNTYNLIASDRNGNPVPAGTSVNFVTEGGQVEQIRQVQLSNGIASAAAAYVSADPRPADGRVTITAYALGEESFIDLNGNNVHDAGEPFQDMGDVLKDNNYNGALDLAEESVSLGTGTSTACVVDSNATFASLLALGADSPSLLNTCDGVWSQRTYVRKAVETVLSTSAARPLWLNVSGLDETCTAVSGSAILATSPSTSAVFLPVAGQIWYGGSDRGTILLIASDANAVRLNPMAAGTEIKASSTAGLNVTVAGGSPVPSTTEATAVALTYEFTDTESNGGEGQITVEFVSPTSLTKTSVSIPISNQMRPSVCVP
jgi:acyl-CoA hydrolase